MSEDYSIKGTQVFEVPKDLYAVDKHTIKETKPSEKFQDVVKDLVDRIINKEPIMSRPGNPGRNIDLNSISAGKDGEIQMSLASGGGFAKVALTKDGAKFTMSTPAYFSNSPGATTQNVLEYEIDFSDLSPKRHAQLVDELKTALQGAGEEPQSKSETALIKEALGFLEQPEVCKSCTHASAMTTISDLLHDIFGDCSVTDLQAFKDKFDAAKPKSAWSEAPGSPSIGSGLGFFTEVISEADTAPPHAQEGGAPGVEQRDAEADK